MGANAQTKVPTFAPAEVLTAANTNLLSNGVGVFSGTATRDAAFGGSGEKVLAEGQFAYLEDTNTTQYYDGASWQSVGVAPGLVLISATTATTVQTFSINNCFSSTYTNYKIVINFSAAVGDGVLVGRLRVGGVNASTNYAVQRLAANINTVSAGQDTSGTDDFFIQNYVAATANRNYIALDICNPAAAAPTSGIAMTGRADLLDIISITHTTATAYDGISFITDGTNFSGTFRVYAYANS